MSQKFWKDARPVTTGDAPMTAIGVEHASLVIEVLVYTALVLAAVA